MNNKLKNILIVILSSLIILLTLNLVNSNNKLRNLKNSQSLSESYSNNIVEEQENNKITDKIDKKKNSKLNKSNPEDIEITQKEIFFYNQDDLREMTGENISFNNIDSLHSSLCDESIWINAGFSKDDSKSIANRFTSSSNQARGILKGITRQNKSLKLILIPINNELKVNIASTSPNYK